MWQDYWVKPTRYLLIQSDMGDRAQIYDFVTHSYHWLESDTLAAAIKSRMREAGVKVVAQAEFDAFRSPIDEFLFEAVQSCLPQDEIEAHLASIENPFLEG